MKNSLITVATIKSSNAHFIAHSVKDQHLILILLNRSPTTAFMELYNQIPQPDSPKFTVA